jgi:hypothetical protein
MASVHRSEWWLVDARPARALPAGLLNHASAAGGGHDSQEGTA